MGDSEAEDTLVVNSKPVFNSAVEFKQSISVSGDIQYAGLDASSIVARKEVYKDINISVVGAVVGENIRATGYIDQFVSVSVYNKTDNALIPSADFEYLKVEMVGAVSTLKFKLKTTSSYAVNSNKVNVVIIG